MSPALRASTGTMVTPVFCPAASTLCSSAGCPELSGLRRMPARESFGMSHFAVYPAVLIQVGIDADSAGVAITTDPFDPADRGAVYVNAKRGLGMKVVEGQKIAEQVIFRPIANAVQVLTRSEEDSLLTFDESGGIKEIPIGADRMVLTDDVVRRLAEAANRIKQVFHGKEQDIEWAFMRGQIYIVQSRPFIAGG